MTSFLADDTKLKPMIIFKCKTMPKEHIPPGVLVHVHEKWLDGRKDDEDVDRGRMGTMSRRKCQKENLPCP